MVALIAFILGMSIATVFVMTHRRSQHLRNEELMAAMHVAVDSLNHAMYNTEGGVLSGGRTGKSK
jgi:hypothetical protein